MNQISSCKNDIVHKCLPCPIQERNISVKIKFVWTKEQQQPVNNREGGGQGEGKGRARGTTYVKVLKIVLAGIVSPSSSSCASWLWATR